MNGMSSHSPAGEEAARPSTSVPLDRRARRRFVAFVGWLFERRADEGSLRIALFMVVVSIATGPVTYLASDQASRASELEDRGLQEAVETAFLERSVDAALAHLHASSEMGADVAHEFGVQSEWDQVLSDLGGFRWAQPTFVGDVPTYPVEEARQRLVDDLDGGRLHELSGSPEALDGQARVERETSLRLILIITLLVAALLLFTIAQVCHDGSRPTGSLLSTEDGMMRLGRLFGMSRP